MLDSKEVLLLCCYFFYNRLVSLPEIRPRRLILRKQNLDESKPRAKKERQAKRRDGGWEERWLIADNNKLSFLPVAI